MQDITGKPELMKKMNLTLVYRALIELQSATRAEISDRIKVSTTTVRTLLEEMLQSGEIIELRLDESSGGRRAQRYALNPNRNLMLSLFLDGRTIVYQVSDLIGNLIKTDSCETDGEKLSVIQFVAKCLKKWKICAVGIGVPGIVENEHYYVNNGLNLWYINNLGEQIQNTYHLPVILENDLNAAAFGFAIHYAKKNRNCDLSRINLAYIFLNKSCSGAGIIVDGKIVHGAKRFAGELGFLPILPNKSLDNTIAQCATNQELAETVARLISIVNCVTNPALVVIGGDFVADIKLAEITASVQKYISEIMQPEIILSGCFKNDYLTGLTHLTTQTVIPLLPLTNATESN